MSGIDFGFTIVGERRVQIRFDTFPQIAHANLLARITDITRRLEARVRAATPVKTGRLADAIKSKVFDDPEKIKGIVTFVNSEAGFYPQVAALEYGSKPQASPVSAHEMWLDHFWHVRLAARIRVNVPDHARQATIVAQRFLRGPLADMSGDIEAQLKQAVLDAVSQMEAA